MCFSATASFSVAGALLPVRAYCVATARRVDPCWLGFAIYPIAFSIQQFADGYVWLGVNRGDQAMVALASRGFLFFSHFFWLAWVPLFVFWIEEAPWRRRLLKILSVVGAVFGLSIFLPSFLFEDRLAIEVVRGSLEYKTVLIYEGIVDRPVLRGFNALIIASALLLASDPRIRTFGFLIVASLGITYWFFAHAFISVWCFFASVLSAYIVGLVGLHRGRSVLRTIPARWVCLMVRIASSAFTASRKAAARTVAGITSAVTARLRCTIGTFAVFPVLASLVLLTSCAPLFASHEASDTSCEDQPIAHGESEVLSFHSLGMQIDATPFPPVKGSASRSQSIAAADAFYDARQGVPAWRRLSDFDALLEALWRLREHGLDPYEYRFRELRSLRDNPDARERLATAAWFAAALDMLLGKVLPSSVEPGWTALPRYTDLRTVLETVLRMNRIAGSLAALAPRRQEYRALAAELVRIYALTDHALPTLLAEAPISSEARQEQISRLHRILIQLRFTGPSLAGDVFSGKTSTILRSVQRDAGLEISGIADSATLGTLRGLLQSQIDQLRVNLERWRWLPIELGERHIRINVAAFTAKAYQSGEVERTHRVIVGLPYRQTPVFSDEIEYIVFNPWWEVPPRIARADKLPLFQRDPASVDRLGFQILNRDDNVVDSSAIDWTGVSKARFPFRLRQAPGAQNALGQVKIIFPNRHNVYMHDTPTRHLFDADQRMFSSGCIRTQDPLGLTQWLLKETPGWNRAKIDQAVATGDETRARFRFKIPVHVLYFTAIGEANGRVVYLEDIYDRDRILLDRLDPDAATRGAAPIDGRF